MNETPLPNQDLQARPARRPMCPPGEHVLTLVSVDAVEVDNLAHRKDPLKDPRPRIMKWAWRFETDEVDPEDALPFEITEWTQDAYGSPRANLTILLDQIIPRATKEQKERIRPRTLLGRRFDVNVIHRQSQTSTGLIAEVQYYKPRPQGDQRPDAPPPAAAKSDVVPIDQSALAGNVRTAPTAPAHPTPRVSQEPTPRGGMEQAAAETLGGEPRDPRFGGQTSGEIPY